MNRRGFLSTAGMAAIGAAVPTVSWTQESEPPLEHRLPATDLDYKRAKSYIEEVHVHRYHWASERAVEAFNDLKFGLRIHWGIYSIFGQRGESWPFLTMSFEERQKYNNAYKTWNPQEFDADTWMSLYRDAGLKMFAFTTKHHEGFSMFDTGTRVRNRADWVEPGGPKIEECDLAYSIIETPFRRDIFKELTTAAHKHNIKIDLYFSHSDWYDADFRPYGWHPLQVPSSPQLWGLPTAGGTVDEFWADMKKRLNGRLVIVPDPTKEQVNRMVERHRAQLTELLTRYGTIDMMCLDIFWGPAVWPQMRETIMTVRSLQPDVMLRARGIGNYGDYYTPEGFVPASKESTRMPWFVIYPLGSSFSYESDATKYKGAKWIIDNLVDASAKATRPRPGSYWSEGDNLRFTRSKDNRTVYCFALSWPGKTLELTSIESNQIDSVELFGYSKKLECRRDPTRGLVITIPDQLQEASNRPSDYVWGFKIVGVA